MIVTQEVQQGLDTRARELCAFANGWIRALAPVLARTVLASVLPEDGRPIKINIPTLRHDLRAANGRLEVVAYLEWEELRCEIDGQTASCQSRRTEHLMFDPEEFRLPVGHASAPRLTIHQAPPQVVMESQDRPPTRQVFSYGEDNLISTIETYPIDKG